MAKAGGLVFAPSSNPTGIVLMALAMFFFASADTIAKFMTAGYHPMQIVGIRQLGLFVGALVYLSIKGLSKLRSRRPGLQFLRGVCATLSAALFVIALSFIPLTDAASIAFAAPFFVPILGYLLLGEPVGVRRWAAIVVGFIGTLIIIRPGFESFHPAYFLVVLAAFLFAARQVISRILGATEPTATTVLFTALTSVALLALVQPFVWRPVAAGDVWLFVLYAAAAGLGEFLVIKALEIAEAVVVAPLQYTMIFWTTGFSFFVFDAMPDTVTFAGAAIIIASGIYSLYREHLAHQRAVGPRGVDSK
ncbi:DMT family transporter [Rhodovulum iodosum]|nr:DMT family transporter [Rhodovulum robiginosum]